MLTQKIDLKIRLYPAAILRRKAKSIDKVTQEERDTLSKMAQIMYEQKGVGLAATQVGIDKALFVADPGNCLYKLINPKIIKRQGQEVLEEGCLSVPEVTIKVKRARLITIKAQGEEGKGVTISAEGLLSRILQHELDHLKGRLIIDYASLWDRVRIRKILKALKKRAGDEKLFPSETKSRQL